MVLNLNYYDLDDVTNTLNVNQFYQDENYVVWGVGKVVGIMKTKIDMMGDSNVDSVQYYQNMMKRHYLFINLVNLRYIVERYLLMSNTRRRVNKAIIL